MASRYLAATAAFALVVLGGSAEATTHTFNFTGDTSTAGVFDSGDGVTNTYIYNYLPLINSDVGLNQIAAFTLSAGDVITGMVTLNNLVTVPDATLGSNVRLDFSFIGPYSLEYTPQIFNFYDNGSPVVAGGFIAFNGSGGSLTLGGLTPYGFPAPDFTFNQITFTATVSEIFDSSSNSIPSVDIPAGSPQLVWQSYFSLPAVPEPTSVTLFASGILGLMRLRSRRR